MSTPKLTITPRGPFKVTSDLESFAFEVTCDGPHNDIADPTWSTKVKDGTTWVEPDQNKAKTLELTGAQLKALDGGQIKVVATCAGTKDDAFVNVEMSPAVTGENPPSGASDVEAPPVWHRWFALAAFAVVAGATAAFVYWGIDDIDVVIPTDDQVKTDPEVIGRFALAAALAKPLMIAGAALVAAGLWMVATEWRGRFVPKAAVRTKGVADAVSLVEALGKLKGSSLVLITGVVLMLGPAWIAASAAGSDPPASTPSDGPSGEPSDGPSDGGDADEESGDGGTTDPTTEPSEQ